MSLQAFLALPKSGAKEAGGTPTYQATGGPVASSRWAGEHIILDDGRSPDSAPASKRRRGDADGSVLGDFSRAHTAPSSLLGHFESDFPRGAGATGDDTSNGAGGGGRAPAAAQARTPGGSVSLGDFLALDDGEDAKSRARRSKDNKRKRSEAPPTPMVPVRSSGTKLGWASTPWQRRQYSPHIGLALHQEIEDFVEYVSATAAERRMRAEVVGRIKAVVTGLWPYAEMNIFGSVAAGIFLPTSDIDMVIQGKWATLPLQTLAKALTDADIPSKMQIIAHARVPIIKLKDAATSLDIDISFNMTGGPEEARRIKEYMKLYPALRPLTLVVKQLLAQRCLNEVYTGGVGSYAILLMIMSFLQGHPRKDGDRPQNLGVLLIEFFELYGIQYNYENVVITTIDGGKYFPKRGEWWVERRPFLLALQNPRDPTQDVSRNSFAIESIRRAFEHAFHVLTSAFVDPTARGVPTSSLDGVHASLLSRIVRLPQEVVDYRVWVAATWPGTPAERFAAATAGRRSPPGTALSSDDDDASPVIEDELDAELSASAHRVSTSSMSNGNGSGNGSGSGGGGSGHASRSGTPARAAAAAADPTFSGEFTAGAIAFACECGKQYPKWASMLGHLKGTGHFNANRSRDHAELKKKCDGTNRAGPRTTIVVQNDEVAKLVGKDGENLDDISARSGANLRVAKDDGDGIRKVTISGTKSQLQKCKVLIKEKTGKKAVTAKKHSAKQRKAEGKVSGKTHKSGLQGRKAAQRERRVEASGPKEPRSGAAAGGKADQMAAWSQRYLEKRGSILDLGFAKAISRISQRHQRVPLQAPISILAVAVAVAC